MAFKFVISEGKQSFTTEKDVPILGKKIGETIEGSLIGLDGYTLSITGGSDNAGFPMRKDIEAQGRKSLIVGKGIGFHGLKKIKKKHFRHEGMKKKKTMAGNTIDQNISQINCVVTKKGDKPLEEILKKKEMEKEGDETEAPTQKKTTEEKPIEEKKEAKPDEGKETPTKEAPKEPINEEKK